MKLKAKFILPTMVLIIAGLAINTWLTYHLSTKSLRDVSLQKAKTNLVSLSSMIDLWVTGAENEIVTISKTASVINVVADQGRQAADLDTVMALLKDSFSRHDNFDNLFVIDAHGTVLTASNASLIGKDMASREYFKKAIAGQIFISSPLFSVDRGEAVFVIAVPIRNGDRTLGVLTAGVKIGQFSKEFVAPLNTNTGYAFIAAPDGLVLAHADNAKVGKVNLFRDTAFGKRLREKASGALDVVTDEGHRIILYQTSPKTGWIIGMAINTATAFADATQLGLIILSLSGLLAVILGGGIWFILYRNVLRPVGGLVASASAIAEGRLDTPLDTRSRDEIGSLQRAMATMVGNLKAKIDEAEQKGRETAAETQKACQAMAEAEQARQRAEQAQREGMQLAAERLEGIVLAVTAASESISGQIDQSSNGSQEQARRIGETATAMEEMNATVVEVAQNASQAAQTADDARCKANEGSDIVTRVIRGIADVQDKALELKDDMKGLGQQAEDIGRIMNVISDIADQTNLLALNAAIEAARAGEAGRGFAVVADEVRKLAEKTMAATAEVGEAIQGIQQGTRKNIGNVDQAVQRIHDATALAGQSGEALGSIVTLVDRTTDQVRSIATASEQQSATTEEINRSIMDINRISGETAEALRQSAQALTDLADQSQVLRGLIEDLHSENETPASLPAAGALSATPTARALPAASTARR